MVLTITILIFFPLKELLSFIFAQFFLSYHIISTMNIHILDKTLISCERWFFLLQWYMNCSPDPERPHNYFRKKLFFFCFINWKSIFFVKNWRKEVSLLWKAPLRCTNVYFFSMKIMKPYSNPIRILPTSKAWFGSQSFSFNIKSI